MFTTQSTSSFFSLAVSLVLAAQMVACSDSEPTKEIPVEDAISYEPIEPVGVNALGSLPKREGGLPESANVTLVGLVPGQYIEGAKRYSYVLSRLEVREGEITELSPISEEEISALEATEETPVLVLKRDGAKDFDVIYPGLIDLHNHTKQNVLPLWTEAKGQFENRWEWRAWGTYKESVSANMNPWIGYGQPITCAAFRWSEFQAMALGTVYLQGPSSCVSDFLIHQVEDKKAYVSADPKINAPTDIIIPADFVFVWNTVRPKLLELAGEDPESNDTETLEKALEVSSYEEALLAVIHEQCPKTDGSNEEKRSENPEDWITDVLSSKDIKKLGNQEWLKGVCGIKTAQDKERFPAKFLRYVYWIHKTVASKKKTFKENPESKLIVHLAEGRREDPYNALEFDLLKLLGLDLKGVNLVHAVGLNQKDFEHMAAKGMGVIWSPLSNIVLYGETLDIVSALKAGVPVALGSDWLPTGTRGVLEEVKEARKYVKKTGAQVSYRDLYNMLTENPAKMIGHFEEDPEDDERGIGTLRVGAAGSLIVVAKHPKNRNNPYQNLVLAEAKDLNLMIVDGRATYGNVSYLNAYASQAEKELLPTYYSKLAEVSPKDFPEPPPKGATKADRLAHLAEVAKVELLEAQLETSDLCGFEEEKAILSQNTLDKNDGLFEFHEATGLNLDRFADIQRIIAVNLFTQSRNALEEGAEFMLGYFPSLYSCNDVAYTERLKNLIVPGSNEDEITQNLLKRLELREEQNLSSVPKRLAEKYGLPYTGPTETKFEWDFALPVNLL